MSDQTAIKNPPENTCMGGNHPGREEKKEPVHGSGSLQTKYKNASQITGYRLWKEEESPGCGRI